MKLSEFKPDFERTINHLKEELSALRTGRAHSALVENMQVKVYDSKLPIKGLASVSIPDAKTIIIEPWDKTIIKEIEDTIRAVGVGVSVINEGTLLRLAIPPLTEESRRELIKILNQKLEATRIAIRQIRDKVKNAVLEAEEKKEIGEDERYRLQDDLDKMTSDYNAEIKKIGEEKEKEIMTV